MIEQRKHTEQHDQLVPVLAEEDTGDELVSSGDMEQDVFQIWCMLADRSPTNASRLAREHFGYDLKPNRIRMWSTRHRWAERASQLYQDTAPTYFERTRAALIAAGPPAANYLLSVVSGEADPDKNMIVASVAALDRIGFLPHTRREAEQGKTPALQSASTDTYEALSDEELRQALAARVAHLR